MIRYNRTLKKFCQTRLIALVLFLIGFLFVVNATEPKPLHQKSFKEIMANYLFVNDFQVKEETRSVSEHLFWRYPLKLPRMIFPIYSEINDPAKEFPVSEGEGRQLEHVNEGRRLFLAGQYEDAKEVWLSARARYGKDYTFHRRTDYFLGLTFLRLAEEKRQKENLPWGDPLLINHSSNATTFLSWAFIVKEDQQDKLIDEVTPKQFYNLSAIYFDFSRYDAAFGAADKGLSYLSKTGRTEYRLNLRRILTEAYIQNRSYLEAVKQFDVALRQDADPKQAAAIFARIGDIYYDLNNFELAEDSYALANRIDTEQSLITPSQYVLRGESLFWLGQFSEAQKMLHYAMDTVAHKNINAPLTIDYQAFANLRLADAYLAQNKFPQAKLEYFKVMNEFRNTHYAKIAQIRHACLELPDFDGHNVMHARNLLDKIKGEDVHTDAIELAWACHVASYSDRERTEDMVSRVRDFSSKYPTSRFLKGLVTPVKEVKAAKLKEFFDRKETYSALSYFENTRKLLYPKIDDNLKYQLFLGYLEINHAEKAEEFWPAFQESPESDTKLLQTATFLSEILDKKPKTKQWRNLNAFYAKKLMTRIWNLSSPDTIEIYINRILATNQADLHLPWIYKLANFFKDKNNKYTCNLIYPVLAKIQTADRAGKIKHDIKADVASIIKTELPKLLESDENCGLSYLTLEIDSLKDRPMELASLYLARQDWPMSRNLVKLYWDVSERVFAAGQEATARELWRIIRDKAPAGTAEINFAKVRLDISRLESERIWQHQ